MQHVRMYSTCTYSYEYVRTVYMYMYGGMCTTITNIHNNWFGFKSSSVDITCYVREGSGTSINHFNHLAKTSAMKGNN